MCALHNYNGSADVLKNGLLTDFGSSRVHYCHVLSCVWRGAAKPSGSSGVQQVM